MAGLSPNLLDGIDPKLFPFDPDQQIASLTQSNSSLAIMNPDVADSSAASHRDLTIAEHHPASSSMGTEEYEALADDDDILSPVIRDPTTHRENSIGFVKLVPDDNDDVFGPVSQGVPLAQGVNSIGFIKSVGLDYGDASVPVSQGYFPSNEADSIERWNPANFDNGDTLALFLQGYLPANEAHLTGLVDPFVVENDDTFDPFSQAYFPIFNSVNLENGDGPAPFGQGFPAHATNSIGFVNPFNHENATGLYTTHPTHQNVNRRLEFRTQTSRLMTGTRKKRKNISEDGNISKRAKKEDLGEEMHV